MSVLVAEYASLVKSSIRRALLIGVSACIHFNAAIFLPFIGLLTTAMHHSSSKRSIATDQNDGVVGAGVDKCFRP